MEFSDQPACYRIRVQGRLDPQWAAWFGNCKLAHAGKDTVLICAIPDQAALYGLLDKIRDLGLTLLLVRRLR